MSLGYLYLVAQFVIKVVVIGMHNLPEDLTLPYPDNTKIAISFIWILTPIWIGFLLWPERDRDTKVSRIVFSLGLLYPIIIICWGIYLFLLHASTGTQL